MKEYQTSLARVQDNIRDFRHDPHSAPVATSLQLAIGILMGGNYQGCAAAVSVAFEQLFPDYILPISPVIGT